MKIPLPLRLTGAACMLATVSLSAPPGSDTRSRAESLAFQKKAIEAYRSRDWAGFLANARRAQALDPDNPRILYTLACAQARNGHAAESAKLLETLLDRRLDFGSESDEDFAAVRGSKEFAGVRTRLERLRRPAGGSRVAFVLPEKDLLTEGVAYDPASRAFFVSSVHRRKIVRRAADGAVSDFVREGQDGIESVLAIAVDPPRGRLYACSAALPQMSGYEKSREGSSALFAFELASGKLAGRWALPADGKPRAANDLAIGSAGEVYVTDSLGSGIYRLRPGAAALDVLVAPGVFRSPQGIGFGPNGRLYVADWGYGLYWLDPEGKRREVEAPPDLPLLGIDGLVLLRRRVFVVQNGIAPHRVAALELDAAGDRIVRGELLDMNDPEFDEPTLAVLVDGALYVNGRSQWGKFDEKTGAFDPGKLREPAILKIDLPR
jgi:hypothetical protein